MKKDISNEFAKVRKLFPHTKKIAYFNTASYGPFSKPLHDIISANLNQRLASEKDDSHDAFAVSDYLRGEYAKLTGATKRSIGIGMSTSYGLNVAAFGLPLKVGDEVLVSDIEFPASAYTWRAASERRGLKLKFIKSRERCFDIEEFKKRINKRTRVLSLSYVQFFNGFKNDLARIAEICRRH